MNIIITRKRIKRFILKIMPNGEVHLSAPLYSSNKDINSFLEKHKEWLEKHYNSGVDYTIPRLIDEGEEIYLLGNRYTIRVIRSTKNKCEINDGFFDIYLKEDSDINKVFNSFINKYRKNIYIEIVNKYLSLTDETINKLSIKNYKTTLGKCYTTRREIILSSRLIYKKREYIEAICLHEIAHLKYPNHQKEFYNYIYKYMPDYKNRLKELTSE